MLEGQATPMHSPKITDLHKGLSFSYHQRIFKLEVTIHNTHLMAVVHPDGKLHRQPISHLQMLQSNPAKLAATAKAMVVGKV